MQYAASLSADPSYNIRHATCNILPSLAVVPACLLALVPGASCLKDGSLTPVLLYPGSAEYRVSNELCSMLHAICNSSMRRIASGTHSQALQQCDVLGILFLSRGAYLLNELVAMSHKGVCLEVGHFNLH